MKTERNHGKLGEENSPRKTSGEEETQKLMALAAEAKSGRRTPLKGQAEVAIILRKRGLGINEISRWLSLHGTPVSAASVCKFFQKTEAHL